MKFIEAAKLGGPEVLRLVDTDTPKPGEGMLLVEVQAAGINYADLSTLRACTQLSVESVGRGQLFRLFR
jgi:NADPH2:quinone reductase